MLFRQLFDPETCTYTYLLADEATREAVLIDAVLEQVDREAELIEQLGLTLRYVLDTHVHADHVTGAGVLRERFGAKTLVADGAGVECADVAGNNGDTIAFGQHTLEVCSTPGHTSGDLTFLLRHEGMAFTGDTLLIRGCGRTDFQQGDSRTLYRSVHGRIFTLPDDTLLYPGHDYHGRTVTTVGEEKRFNPRLGGGRSEDAFVEIMAALKLPYPKRIDASLPANQNCGVATQGGQLGAGAADGSERAGGVGGMGPSPSCRRWRSRRRRSQCRGVQRRTRTRTGLRPHPAGHARSRGRVVGPHRVARPRVSLWPAFGPCRRGARTPGLHRRRLDAGRHAGLERVRLSALSCQPTFRLRYNGVGGNASVKPSIKVLSPGLPLAAWSCPCVRSVSRRCSCWFWPDVAPRSVSTGASWVERRSMRPKHRPTMGARARGVRSSLRPKAVSRCPQLASTTSTRPTAPP